MIRYYCSGFDENNAFGHGLGEMLKKEIKEFKSIVYIPAGEERIQRAYEKHLHEFREHFNKIGISFEKEYVLEPKTINTNQLVKNANFIMLMGGDPFKLKEYCKSLGIIKELKEYDGVMMGYSAGAMFMSKYIIVTPCSDEYPEYKVEEGLNLDELTIYPHNNTNEITYPDEVHNYDEIYLKKDLIQAAKDYGTFYLLQDYLNENGKYDISIIKSNNGEISIYRENEGKIWESTREGINILK